MFAVDIDETITQDEKAFATYMVQKLGLPVDVSTIANFECFLSHPEVQAYRQKYEKIFWQCFKQAGYDETVLKALSPRDGAIDGINYLLQQDRAAYYTLRATHFQELTQQWLQTHNFPVLEYYPCRNFLQKYFQLFIHTRDTGEPAILIDDNAERIAHFWPQVVEKWPPIGRFFPQRFVLVAFGSSQETLFSSDVPFPVVPLPTWELSNIENFVVSIQQCFKEKKFYV